MTRVLLLSATLFTIQILAQEPYNFKEFKENHLLTDSSKKLPGKPQTLSRVMGKITFSNPGGTFILPLDKNMSADSLQAILEKLQKLTGKHTSTFMQAMPNGTKVYALPQDNMLCLIPDMSQFSMPVIGKGVKITGMPPGSFQPNDVVPGK